MLDPTLSRARQKRLLAAMQERKLDAVVIGLPHHVYYLSAFHPFWLHQSAFVLFADGRSWVTSGGAKPPENAAADDALTFESNYLGTIRQEQPLLIGSQVVPLLKSRRAKQIAIDASPVTAQIAIMLEQDLEPIGPTLWQMRRQKDPDELALMRKAAKCAEAMYRAAREVVKVGVPEIEVFTAMQAAAVREAGEPMTALLGNDYACGGGGGPPRAGRTANAGEIYILDVGPSYRHYFADVCRSFCVDRNPTDAQMSAWSTIKSALQIVEQKAKPGVRCREIFSEVSEHYRQVLDTGMPHHLGHGVGLQPHEYPHLNPKWDDVLMENEVFTAEPGIYSPDLRAGIRLENLYVVTKTGVENMVNVPLELV